MEHVRLDSRHAAWLETRLARGDYASADAYVAALIEEAARVDARERLTALLEEGLRGPATEWTDADAEHLRRLAAGED